jgi:hypothetical protein
MVTCMPPPVDLSITDPAAMQLASEDRERAVAQARIDADTINAATSSVGATLTPRRWWSRPHSAAWRGPRVALRDVSVHRSASCDGLRLGYENALGSVMQTPCRHTERRTVGAPGRMSLTA